MPKEEPKPPLPEEEPIGPDDETRGWETSPKGAQDNLPDTAEFVKDKIAASQQTRADRVRSARRTIRSGVGELTGIMSSRIYLNKLSNLHEHYQGDKLKQKENDLILESAASFHFSDELAKTLIEPNRRYLILGRLKKQGGMEATVFKAKALDYDDRVDILKLFDPDEVEEKRFTKFVEEARLAASLQSPYVTRIRFGNFDDVSHGFYYMMEKVEGEDLEQILARQLVPFSETNVKLVAKHMLLALKAVHRERIVHGDIKPGNIFQKTEILQSPGGDEEMITNILGDFGLAKKSLSEDTKKPVKQEFEQRPGEKPKVYGTPFYLSPEQAIGAKLTSSSDIFSLGVTLYYLVSTKTPFGKHGDEVEDIMTAVAIGDHLTVNEALTEAGKEPISQEFSDFIELMLKHGQAERPDAEELLNKLDSLGKKKPWWKGWFGG